MAKAEIMIASWMLAGILLATVSVDQVVGGPDDPNFLDCRYNESDCRYCCDHMRGKSWTIKLTKRRLFKNICECTNPAGDKTVRLVSKRM